MINYIKYIFCVLAIFVFLFKAPGFKNGVYEGKYECDECTFLTFFKQQGRVFHSQAFDAFGIILSVSFSCESVYKPVKIDHVYLELMYLKGSYIFPINIRFKFEFKLNSSVFYIQFS